MKFKLLLVGLVIMGLTLGLGRVFTQPSESSGLIEESEQVSYTLISSYEQLMRQQSLDALPSLFQGVRFRSTGDQLYIGQYHTDGRAFPGGVFVGYFDHEVHREMRLINTQRPVQNFELYYPIAHHVMHAIGQLPVQLQAEIETVELILNEDTLSLNNKVLRLGHSLAQSLQMSGGFFNALMGRFNLIEWIDEAAYQARFDLDLGPISDQALENLNAEVRESVWALLALHHPTALDAPEALKRHMHERISYLHDTLNFVQAEAVLKTQRPALPKHDTMNMATNAVHVNLIQADDPSWFERLNFLGTYAVDDRRSRNRNAPEQFDVHVFEAVYGIDHTLLFSIEASVTQAKAQQQAQWLAHIFGQMPGLMLRGYDDFHLYQGDGYGLYQVPAENMHRMGMLEETILHELAHSSLDWKWQLGTNYNLALVDRNAWLAAAAADDHFISYYARDYPAREDIAEFIQVYFLARWRPERVDPLILEYYETHFPHRLALLDQFDWELPQP